MFKRIIQKSIESDMFWGKIIMILGARQVGKTSLVEEILKKYEERQILRFNGDILPDREVLSGENIELLHDYIEDKDIIFIDEAQKIENISDILKILVDRYKKEKQIIVTGSSSIHLLDLTSETLTGRKRVYNLYWISAEEIILKDWFAELDRNLEIFLIYWSYPEVLNQTSINDKKNVLAELTSSSLYRDILEFQQIKNSHVIQKLLKLLSLQVGKEISLNKLGQNLWIDMKTVEKYIDLLEKSYVIFRLPPFFSNKKKEINKSNKIYFYDLGVRNTILGDFRKLSDRSDVWEIWENYLIVERKKKNSYYKNYANMHFWRNYAQQEIDYIEDTEGWLQAYEIKYSQKNAKTPSGFSWEYWDAPFQLIHRKNYKSFIG